RGPMADSCQDVVEGTAAAVVIADVIGCYGPRPVASRELGASLQHPAVFSPEVIVHLDEDVLPAEGLLQRAKPVLVVGGCQEEEIAGMPPGRLQRGSSLALGLILVGEAEKTGEIRVAATGAGKDHQLTPVDFEAGADDGVDADVAAGLQKADSA